MASRRKERRRARECAVALLYSSDITERGAIDIVEQGAYPDTDIEVSEYAEGLVAGVVEHLDEIDARLASTSENWAVDRMPVVDRAILRLAVYEMAFVDEVPISVAINEAVELAKLYGGEDESARFVNGVLGRIARAAEAPAADASAAEDAAGADATETPEGEIAAVAQEVSAAAEVADPAPAERGSDDPAAVQDAAEEAPEPLAAPEPAAAE